MGIVLYKISWMSLTPQDPLMTGPSSQMKFNTEFTLFQNRLRLC